jgi:hypothetical protein
VDVVVVGVAQVRRAHTHLGNNRRKKLDPFAVIFVFVVKNDEVRHQLNLTFEISLEFFKKSSKVG